MRLRNKKTGEIIETDYMFGVSIPTTETFGCKSYDQIAAYSSLAELNEEWEDYEAPAYYYFIQDDGRLGCDAVEPYNHKPKVEEHKSIGNHFETKEEAEKAVEKLKALKRLKDKGFRFEGWQDLGACDETERLVVDRIVDGENIIGFSMDDYHDCIKDLNICFGGEK